MHFKAAVIKVVPVILFAAWWFAAFPPELFSQPIAALASANTLSVSSESSDPIKTGSELNHHLAGYALIAIGLLVIAGQSGDKLRSLQIVWPFVFIAFGLFLVIWSDGEMWPRGNLNWLWMVHHDLEARQHKTYAILLVALGIIEYLRARGKLSRFWRTWAFSILAVAGVVLLVFHDHHVGPGGADSPEAHKYWISWSIAGVANAAAPQAEVGQDPVTDMHDMVMPESATSATQEPAPAPADHSGMEMSFGEGAHQHVMPAEMIRIQHQHMWFALIGFAVVVFKFIDDSALWHRRFVPFLWPGWIALLGILLVFYAE